MFRPGTHCRAWWCYSSSSSLLNWNFLDLCWGTQTVVFQWKAKRMRMSHLVFSYNLRLSKGVGIGVVCFLLLTFVSSCSKFCFVSWEEQWAFPQQNQQVVVCHVPHVVVLILRGWKSSNTAAVKMPLWKLHDDPGEVIRTVGPSGWGGSPRPCEDAMFKLWERLWCPGILG